MKKIFILITLLFLASCWWNNESTSVTEDTNPDVKSLYVQACENKDSSCKQLLCTKNEKLVFICSDSITPSNNCGEEKSFDKIIEKYKICSDKKELLKNSIFNYSEKPNEFFEKMTANEITKKIEEETKKVEEWWKSEWLWTFLASAGWALIWGFIADKLFWGWTAQVPQIPNNIENNRSIDKNILSKTKEEEKKAMAERIEKRKAEIKKLRAERKLKESKARQEKKAKAIKKRRK